MISTWKKKENELRTVDIEMRLKNGSRAILKKSYRQFSIVTLDCVQIIVRIAKKFQENDATGDEKFPARVSIRWLAFREWAKNEGILRRRPWGSRVIAGPWAREIPRRDGTRRRLKEVASLPRHRAVPRFRRARTIRLIREWRGMKRRSERGGGWGKKRRNPGCSSDGRKTSIKAELAHSSHFVRRPRPFPDPLA